MPKPEDCRITTVEIHEQVKPAQLAAELHDAVLAASSMRAFVRLENCHNTRRCCWEGQQEDGRRGPAEENERMFRWRDAPDLRVPLADTVIRRLMLIRAGVINRGDLRIAPRKVKPDQGQGEDMAAVWQDVLEYFLDITGGRISSSMDLFSVCVEEFGYCGLLPDWQPKKRMELKKITLQQIADTLIAKARNEADLAMEQAGADVEGVNTEALDAEIANQVAGMIEMMLMDSGAPSKDQIELLQVVDAAMSTREARRVIMALRKAAGDETEYHAPRDDGGVPHAKVLVPWINFIHPHDMSGTGETGWFDLPEYLTESDITERAKLEKWDKKATKKLIENHKNKLFHTLYSAAGRSNGGTLQGWIANGVGVGLEASPSALEKNPRWLVIYQYRRVVDADGLPRVIKCAFHPSMCEEDDLLMWQETDHDKLPLIVDTAEPVAFAMLARGVCDIVVDKQNFIKDSLDSEGARSQLGSNPPLLRGVKDHVGVKPGKEMYARRSGQSFEGSQFMDVPEVDQGTFAMMDKVERAVLRYYFDAEDTPDDARRMFQEWLVFRQVRVYRELVRMMWKIIQENIDEVQASTIGGRAVRLSATRDQLQGEADIQIGVHVDGYTEEAAEKFIDGLGKLVQMDRGGNVDWSAATEIACRLISPTYSRRLIMPAAVASGRIIDDQETRIAKIMAGVPVRYEERVSNPKLRQQVLTQWAQMPGNVQRAAQDPSVGEMMQKEYDMLQFQDEQQSVNPVTGRTGVKPNQPQQPALA